MDGQGLARIEEVQTVVAELFLVTRADLKSACRRREFAYPRQWAMKLARELTGKSYPQIGRMFGGRDHTTVLFAYRKISALEKSDPAIAENLQWCRARIAQIVSERLGITLGSSTEWTPPPPLRLAKPSSVSVAFDLSAWQRMGGELEVAA